MKKFQITVERRLKNFHLTENLLIFCVTNVETHKRLFSAVALWCRNIEGASWWAISDCEESHKVADFFKHYVFPQSGESGMLKLFWDIWKNDTTDKFIVKAEKGGGLNSWEDFLDFYRETEYDEYKVVRDFGIDTPEQTDIVVHIVDPITNRVVCAASFLKKTTEDGKKTKWMERPKYTPTKQHPNECHYPLQRFITHDRVELYHKCYEDDIQTILDTLLNDGNNGGFVTIEIPKKPRCTSMLSIVKK